MIQRKWILTVIFLIMGFIAALSFDFQVRDWKIKTKDTQSNQVKIDKRFGKMPLYFIPNKGQLDKQVYYYVQGKDKTVYFTSQGVTFSLHNEKSWVVKLEFVGARKNVKPISVEKTGTVISYFRGKPEEWKTGLEAASKITYRDLWPGIDLEYSGTVNQMKYQFVVHPGANPSKIRMTYHGAGDVGVNHDGSLEVKTPAGSFHDGMPVAWQEISGKRVGVSLNYALEKKNNSIDDSYTYGFSIGKYDRNRALILDPAVIIYCGYIGGTGDDTGHAIVVDAAGCAYVTGATYSTEATFPVKSGPDLTYNGGGCDAFVAKVKPDGDGLIYCGYIGGSGNDYGNGIAVDTSGCAYIAGQTGSTETSFPVRFGPDLTYKGGTDDAFVAKVNANGTQLIYCGYIGGPGDDVGYVIAVDASGCAYVGGYTGSSETQGFPVKVGPDLTYNGGTHDGVVAKIKADGSGLIYCGYIGGSDDDDILGIAIDASGCIYATGLTYSTETQGFPAKSGPDLTHNGYCDSFIAKVKADGSILVYCGYIGGISEDVGRGIAVDRFNCAYVTGYTQSTEATFPVKIGPDLTYNGGPHDAFVAKTNASGALVYCGYIGGSDDEIGLGITVDDPGSAYLIGYTASNEATFPVLKGPGLVYKGGLDAFVAEVKRDGTGLNCCGYIGGSSIDAGFGIAIDGWGNAYVTGYTNSTEAQGFPVKWGPDLIFNGGYKDAFVSKIYMYYTLNFLAEDGGFLIGNPSQNVKPGGSSTYVMAIANDGYRFVNWAGTGGFVTTTANPLKVTNVNSDMDIKAHFASTFNPAGWFPIEGLQYNMIAFGEAYNVNKLAVEGDWIGAFGPGGTSDCRGAAKVGVNGKYYLTIRSNATSGETISFKLWPLPSGPALNAAETISFVADETIAGFPLHFGTLEQKFNLVNGWNWISFNVLPASTSLNSVFGSLGGAVEQVKSQGKAAVYSNGNWTGDLINMNGIVDGVMYKIKLNQARALTITGIAANYNKPLCLVTGYNWTAYLPIFPQSVGAAVNSIINQVNQIKSQTQSAIKSGSTFFGDLIQMEPNKGYAINMNAPGTLVYPYGESPLLGRTAKKDSTGTQDAPPVPWKVINGNQYNMIAYGKVYLNGKPIHTTGYYLVSMGAWGFADSRSISPVGKDGSFFATILGSTNGETITFKLYDTSTRKTYAVSSSLTFKVDDLNARLILKAKN